MPINKKPIILTDNRFLDGPISVTDAAEGFSVDNIKDYRIYTRWKAASTGTKNISVDCGAGVSKEADCLAIIGHNLSPDATLSVLSSDDDVTYTTRVDKFTPAQNKAFMKTFPIIEARYWRIQIIATDPLIPYLAVVMLGTKLIFERYLQSEFDPFFETIEAESQRSKTGNLLGNTVNFISKRIKASWGQLTPSWVQDEFKPVWDNHLSQLKPFFWTWDITNHPDEVYYVKIPDNFTLFMPYDPVRRSLTLEMEGIRE